MRQKARYRTVATIGAGLLSAALLAGCTLKMEARAVTDYAGTPKRMIVVATEGATSLGIEWTTFQARVMSGMQTCGVQTEVHDLARGPATTLLRRLRDGDAGQDADVVLRVQPVGSDATLIGGQSIVMAIRYETLVTERSSGRALFRGRVEIPFDIPFRPRGAGGERAATMLIRQLATDNIVRSCPRP